MKMLGTILRLGAAVAVAVVLFVLLGNTLINPVAVDTRDYTADFTDASGLHPDGDVRVRGVRVGKVKSVDLASGRPVIEPAKQTGVSKGKVTGVCPSLEGAVSPASPPAY